MNQDKKKKLNCFYLILRLFYTKNNRGVFFETHIVVFFSSSSLMAAVYYLFLPFAISREAPRKSCFKTKDVYFYVNNNNNVRRRVAAFAPQPPPRKVLAFSAQTRLSKGGQKEARGVP